LTYDIIMSSEYLKQSFIPDALLSRSLPQP